MDVTDTQCVAPSTLLPPPPPQIYSQNRFSSATAVTNTSQDIRTIGTHPVQTIYLWRKGSDQTHGEKLTHEKSTIASWNAHAKTSFETPLHHQEPTQQQQHGGMSFSADNSVSGSFGSDETYIVRSCCVLPTFLVCSHAINIFAIAMVNNVKDRNRTSPLALPRHLITRSHDS